MIEMKLCKNCKWRGRNWFIFEQYQYCYHPKVIEEAYKHFSQDWEFARLARDFGPCYREGRFYERRK